MKSRLSLREWFQEQVSQVSARKAKPRARRLAVRPEALESRWVLAGNVTAQVLGDSLFITGGADNEAVTITASGSNLVLRGLDTTTINGAATDFVIRSGSTQLKGDLHANFLGGNDTLIVANGVRLRQFNYVNMGDGNDLFGLSNASIRKYLDLDTGNGNDSVSLQTGVIHTSAAFRLGDGDDTFTMKDSVVGRYMSLDAGNGNDSIVFDGVSGGRTIGRGATILTGAGNDNVVARNAGFSREFYLDTAAGDDYVDIDPTTFSRTATMLLGAGNDNVVMDGANAFRQDLIIIGQGGTDLVDIESTTTFSRGRTLIDTDGTTVPDAVSTDRLNNATTGALTLATQIQQQVTTLAAPPALTVTITPTSVAENAGTNAVTGTITRNGATTSALTVNLASDDTSEATVPATVTIAAGSATADFNITAVDDTFVDGAKTVTFTASLNGFTSGTDTLSVTDNETGNAALTVSLNPAAVGEAAGATASTGTVSRNTDTAAALTVNLASSDTSEATVGATVTIPAGQTSVTFPIAAVNDTTSDGNQTVTITASAAAHDNGTANLTVQDDEIALTLSTAGNSALQSNETLITKTQNFVVSGTTLANASVELDSDNDGQFDDGAVTADTSGAFSITVPLSNTTTNRGANRLQFRATAASGGGTANQEVSVHFAVGSVVRFTSNRGVFDIELLDAAAPATVANFKRYFDRYANSIIHRSPDNFVIQGGGFTVNSAGAVNALDTFPAIANEFSSANSNVAGTLSLALSGSPDSGQGGWFINTRNNSSLDAAFHTVFGRVIGGGMDIVEAINNEPLFNINLQLGFPATSIVFATTPLVGTLPFEDLTGTVSVSAGSTTVTGVGTAFTTQLAARVGNPASGGTLGSIIRIGGQDFEVTNIASATQLTLSSAPTAAQTNVVAQRQADPNQANYIVFSSIGEILN